MNFLLLNLAFEVHPLVLRVSPPPKFYAQGPYVVPGIKLRQASALTLAPLANFVNLLLSVLLFFGK